MTTLSAIGALQGEAASFETPAEVYPEEPPSRRRLEGRAPQDEEEL